MEKFNYVLNQNKAIDEGDMLIAEPLLGDINFERAVIVVCNKDEDGTFGLVVNNKSKVVLSDLFPELENTNIAIYKGGPMQVDFLSFIHQYPNEIGGKKIHENVYFGGDFAVVKKLIIQNKIAKEKIKFFLGYSGWDAEQLENEIIEKTWIVSPFHLNIIFSQNPSSIWKNAVEQLGPSYKHLLHFPKNISHN